MTTGAFSRNVSKLFSELKLVTDSLLSIYAAANWKATESLLSKSADNSEVAQNAQVSKGIITQCRHMCKCHMWNV